MAILVLEPLPVERGPSRRGAQEESLGLDVSRQPDQVPDALEAEHGIVNIERHHVDCLGRIGRSCRNERRHCPRLGDAFLEDLALLGLFVIEEGLHIDWLIKLAKWGVDADLTEQGIHAKGPGFVGDDGHNAWSHLFVPQQIAQ